MKKTLLILAMLVMAVLPSCKKTTPDEIKDPSSAYEISQADLTFETQFKAIWEALNQSYVLWDYDTVNWDARRDKLINLGKSFDEMQNAGTFVFKEHLAEVNAMFDGLLDHHLVVYYVDTKTYKSGAASPGKSEVKKREEYHKAADFSTNVNALYQMAADSIITLDAYNYADYYCSGLKSNVHMMSCLINGNIPYLRMSGYPLLEIVRNISETADSITAKAFSVVDDFYANIKYLKENNALKGIILDNRGNGGGYQLDAQFIAAPFITSDMVMMKARTKSGLGKYDFSVWKDVIMKPLNADPKYANVSSWYVGDLGNIPYVAMEDMNSISMGEITGSCVAHLNSGYIIGERSRGGHGGLNSGKTYEQQGWCGIIRYDNYHHELYNPLECCKIWNNHTNQFEMQEGIGLIPNKEVKLDMAQLEAGYDNQLMETINYINGK